MQVTYWHERKRTAQLKPAASKHFCVMHAFSDWFKIPESRWPHITPALQSIIHNASPCRLVGVTSFTLHTEMESENPLRHFYLSINTMLTLFIQHYFYRKLARKQSKIFLTPCKVKFTRFFQPCGGQPAHFTTSGLVDILRYFWC